MKTYLKITISIIALPILLYACFAFVTLEINPASWTEAGRFFYWLLTVTVSLIISFAVLTKQFER